MSFFYAKSRTCSFIEYKYIEDGKPKFLYSWRLVPTDPQPVGKQPCLSFRELEKMVRQDIDSKLDPLGRKMTVNELIERYFVVVKHFCNTYG